MKIPKYAEIKIKNLVATGNFNFRRKLGYNEINRIMEKSCLGWDIMNQETTPYLFAYIVREDSSKIYVCLWHTGSFFMTGLKSEKEAMIYFREVLKELKKSVPHVFEEKQLKVKKKEE